MTRFYLSVAGLIANLIGTLMIFFALSFTSIGFRVATEPTLGRTELCFGGIAFMDSVGHLMSAPCPENSNGQIAIVNSFHPLIALFGLGFVVLGSLLALLTIEKPRTSINV
jgi:hypothetical protein